MARTVFMGAGSGVFARNLVQDILIFPELHDREIALMDIHRERLAEVKQWVEKLMKLQASRGRVEAAEDRRTALAGADDVILPSQVGGIAAWERDIQIPMAYGVSQCVGDGDTLGPGGIFRRLRHLAVLDGVVEDIVELCTQALYALKTGHTIRIKANVANTGLISNLPSQAGVEVPCRLNRADIHPGGVGDLPALVAALNRQRFARQGLTILGHRRRDRDFDRPSDGIGSVDRRSPQLR